MSGIDLTKPLPSAPEAEQSILAAIMARPSRVGEAAAELAAKDFHNPAHRFVYAAMLRLREESKSIDLVTVGDMLKRMDALNEAGGPVYLAEIAAGHTGNFAECVRIVKAMSTRRELIATGYALVDGGHDLGRDIAEVARLAEKAQASAQGVGSRLVVADAGQLLSMALPPREYILHPVIPRQGLAMLYAPRGIGKTYMALTIAYAVASGQWVFRWHAPRPRRVLYLDGEMPANTMQERLASIVAGFEQELPAPDWLRFITPDLQGVGARMPNLATPEGQAALLPHLAGVELLVMDNLATLARAGRENDSEGWLPVQEWLLGLRQRGLSVCMVHHAGKNGLQRGTSSREDVLDTVIALKRPHDYRQDEGARFEVHLEKARGICGDDAKSFEAQLDNEGQALVWRCRDIEDVRLAQVRELLSQGLSIRDIQEETGFSKSTVHRLKKKAEAA